MIMPTTPLPSRAWGCVMAVGMVALFGIFAGAMSSSRETPAPVASPVVTEAAFVERLPDDDWPLLKKQDRLALPTTEPVPVKTESFAMASPDQPLDDDKKKAKPVERKRHVAESEESNVCTRHHMRKVVIGRSWRCRK